MVSKAIMLAGILALAALAPSVFNVNPVGALYNSLGAQLAAATSPR